MKQKIENHNVRRWNTIQVLKRKNLELSSQIMQALPTFESKKRPYMEKLSKHLGACSSLSLYAEDLSGKVTGITGHQCGDKLCFVCNSQRSKATRRKYLHFFSENPTLIEIIDKKGNTKVVTRLQYNRDYKGQSYSLVNYDVMHFTLTVPHSAEHGFRGQKLYYSEFTKCLTELRRLKFFKTMILGGEYGIETERKESGAHIHVHGLFFVRSAMQNRNHLHRHLLLNWNRLTIDEKAKRVEFNESDFVSIKKGNKLLTDDDCRKLDPRGATFIGLNNIYTYNEAKEKVYSLNTTNKRFMKGVMEAIKYHFEPLFFDKENKTFDLQAIADIKPLIAGKPLYKKFGCLVGETYLNLSENIKQEFNEALQSLDGDVDPGTGEIIERNYFIINPAFMYANDKQLIYSNAALQKRRQIKVNNSSKAIEQLTQLIKQAGKSGQL